MNLLFYFISFRRGLKKRFHGGSLGVPKGSWSACYFPFVATFLSHWIKMSTLFIITRGLRAAWCAFTAENEIWFLKRKLYFDINLYHLSNLLNIMLMMVCWCRRKSKSTYWTFPFKIVFFVLHSKHIIVLKKFRAKGLAVHGYFLFTLISKNSC